MVDFAGFTGVPPPPIRALDMRVAGVRPLQSLEHEMGGVKIYETALKCVLNEDLKEEWEKYHQETERHVQILQDVFSQMQLDANEQTPGRKIVHDMGQSLVKAMEASVLLAETKDHANWELIGEVSKKMTGSEGNALKEAYAEVEDQEDQRKDVHSAIGAARAKAERTKMR
jgi:hypothetical protein